MIKKILFQDKDLHFSSTDFPILIHGDDGFGASLFSVCVMADLYEQGANIVFLCGFHMAREEFNQQTHSDQDSILVDDEFTAADIESKRVIFIPSNQPELLAKVLKTLSDTQDRVIFFKNFDLFDKSIYSTLDSLSNVVMMGNIDACAYKKELLDKKWMTQIYFSTPTSNVDLVFPLLEKYNGYLTSDSRAGIVRLQ